MGLSADRNTTASGTPGDAFGKRDYLMAASTKIYQGGLTVLSGGYAAPGSTATSLIAVGVARAQVDNSTGSAGALTVEVSEGCFWFVNSGSDLVVQADVGSDCYITDDQTVNHTSTGKSRAGKVLKLDTNLGVLVKVGLGI